MHEDSPQLHPEPSITGVYLDILVAPWRAFSSIQENIPVRAYWLLPVVLYIVCSMVCTQIIVSQPAPAAHLRALGEEEFQPQLERYIADGTITRQQADWLKLFITPGNSYFVLTQLVGIALTSFITLFAVGFIVWQLGRSVLGRSVSYKKVLEIIGLTFLIGVLERIVSAILVVATGSIFASPSPGMLLLDNIESKAFLVLSSVNIFTLWELWVVSNGLSVFFERDFVKVLVLVSALWLLWTLVTIVPIIVA